MRFEIIMTDYRSAEGDIRYVRDQVFLIEQGIDRDQEFDDRDMVCWHAIVYENNRPLATGRIDVAKEGKVGRVAVVRERRRRGLGTLVMQALEAHAAKMGLARVWFHAQITAVPFYESLGYHVCSDEFEEANIRHVAMEKRTHCEH